MSVPLTPAKPSSTWTETSWAAVAFSFRVMTMVNDQVFTNTSFINQIIHTLEWSTDISVADKTLCQYDPTVTIVLLHDDKNAFILAFTKRMTEYMREL